MVDFGSGTTPLRVEIDGTRVGDRVLAGALADRVDHACGSRANSRHPYQQ